jgi:hypothetical protein
MFDFTLTEYEMVDPNKPKCPHCGGSIDPGYNTCTHCSQAIVWLGNLVGKPGQEKQMEAYRDQLQQKKKIERQKREEARPQEALEDAEWHVKRTQNETKKHARWAGGFAISALILIIFAINVDLAVAIFISIFAVGAILGAVNEASIAYQYRKEYLEKKEQFISQQRYVLRLNHMSAEQKSSHFARSINATKGLEEFEFGSDGFQVASDEIDLDPFLEQS